MTVTCSYRLRTAIILCGGQGTRFRAISEKTPKILASIGTKKLIDLLVDNLVKQGLKRVVLATGHLSEVVEAYISECKDIDIFISREERPLGTGGALKKAFRLIEDENVLVLNGDTVIEVDIKKMSTFHHELSADFTICLTSQNPDGEYGRVRLNDDYTIAELKAQPSQTLQYTNAGVYIVRRGPHLEGPIEHSSLENEDLPNWINSKKVLAYVIDKPLFDIGTPGRYRNFLNNFNDG